MSRVDQFALITEIHDDTKFPLQFLGGGNPPAPRQVEWSVIISKILASLGLSTSDSNSSSTYTYSLPAGKWLVGVAVQSADTQSFNLGLSPSADELVSGGAVTGGGAPGTFGVLLYGGTDGVDIYFSGLTGSTTLTFLIL